MHSPRRPNRNITWTSEQSGRAATQSRAAIEKGQAQRRVASPVIGWAFWLVNLVAFGGLCGWILLDGKFSETVLALPTSILQHFTDDPEAGRRWPELAGRLLLLKILGALAMGSAVGIFASLFFGARTHRRVRSWLALTVLAAAWLTLTVSWRELAWRSQAFRLKSQLDGFEAVAAALRSDWPTSDGESEQLGPYMAYPQGAPRVLLLLTIPQIDQTNASFVAVERSPAGALRFQLAGNEPGAWLEWHPRGSSLQPFVGGLQTDYEIVRSAPLGSEWFLVRYHALARK
jgi:hypothetical protein